MAVKQGLAESIVIAGKRRGGEAGTYRHLA